MPSLKRDEAINREQLLSVKRYDVDLDFTTGTEVFRSVSTIRFGCATPGESTFIEVDPRLLRRVTLNGSDLPVEAWESGRYPLPDLAAENELKVVADMAYSHDGEGMHRFTDPEDGLVYIYMMGFLDMASRVFACFEQPDLKAPYRFSVTAPQDWTVIGNEVGTQVGPGKWEFKQSNPMATYFVSLVAGPYHSVYRRHGGTDFGLHARQSYRQALDTDVDEIFEITFGCWDRFHELYGVEYAFGASYDQCFVPEFNAGAMENPGCVTFRDEAFMFRSAVTDTRRQSRAAVIAHEMAHMWFGDLVTMTWWDDLWLNESFATYMGYRGAAEASRFTAAAADWAANKSVGYRADQRPSTHPMSGTITESGDALNNFDGISYYKGSAILNQLAAWIGDDAFFAGVRGYLTQFRYSNASLHDLMRHLGAASGRDMADWTDRWLCTTGVNTLQLDASVSNGKYTSAAIVQTAPSQPSTLRPHHIRVGLYRVTDGIARRVAQITANVDGERTQLSELIGMAVADLVLVNDDDLTFAKSPLDADSLASVSTVLSTVEDSMARAVLWRTLVEMVRDGQLEPRRYLEILAEALPAEGEVSQVETQLSFARGFVVDQCMVGEERIDCLRRLSTISERLITAVVPGNGIALAGLRFLIGAAVSDADVTRLRNMYEGMDVPGGITIDDQLRWAILLRLCVLGEASQSLIDAQLASDRSSEGHKYAAQCRAAMPEVEAKAAAWQTVMTDHELSNHLLLATAGGFWWPEQLGLLADYVPRFFAEAPDGLGRRAPWEVRGLAKAMFPHYCAQAHMVEAAQQMLSRTDLAPGLHRSVVDDVDDAERVLRVRGE